MPLDQAADCHGGDLQADCSGLQACGKVCWFAVGVGEIAAGAYKLAVEPCKLVVGACSLKISIHERLTEVSNRVALNQWD